MRKTILAMLCMAVAGTTSCAQQKQSKNAEQGNKVLVAYFSATGNTAKAAKSLQEPLTGNFTPLRPKNRTPTQTSTGTTRNPGAQWK